MKKPGQLFNLRLIPKELLDETRNTRYNITVSDKNFGCVCQE